MSVSELNSSASVATHEQLGFLDRLLLLIYYYIPLPYVGVNQKLVVADKKLKDTEVIVVAVMAGLTLTSLAYNWWLAPTTAYAVLLILATVCVYAFSPVPQIVLEYRVYFSLFGFAILAATVAEFDPPELASGTGLAAVLLLAVYFIQQSRRRARLYADPVRFWQQATHDCPSTGVLSAYVYYLSRRGRYSDAAGVMAQKLAFHVSHAPLKLTDEQRNDPDMRILLLNMAHAHAGSGQSHESVDVNRLDESISIVSEVTHIWPDYAPGWRNLGALQIARAEVEDSLTKKKTIQFQAVASLSKAVNLDPNDGMAWYGLGMAHMQLDDYDYAKPCLLTAVELCPQVPEVRLKLVELLDKIGDPLLALPHVKNLHNSGIIFVTEDMLPPEIRERMEKNDGESQSRTAESTRN